MLKFITKATKKNYSIFECTCGNQKEIRNDHVRHGYIKSCGCLRREKSAEAAKKLTHREKHGFASSSTYGIWCSLKQRCRNPNNKFFPYYGGRGIDYCERWEKFENFLSDMGERPEGLTIERIENSLGYSPENCKWATRKEQQRNRRGCVYVEHNGQRKTLIEWYEELGIPHQTLSQRVLLGWAAEKILSLEKFTTTAGLALGGKASGERQKAKTHCPYGHEYTPENIAPQGKDGKGRSCRKCRAIRESERRARKKHQAPTLEPRTE